MYSLFCIQNTRQRVSLFWHLDRPTKGRVMHLVSLHCHCFIFCCMQNAMNASLQSDLAAASASVKSEACNIAAQLYAARCWFHFSISVSFLNWLLCAALGMCVNNWILRDAWVRSESKLHACLRVKGRPASDSMWMCMSHVMNDIGS